MGCGKSSLGSDSPKNSQEDNCGPEVEGRVCGVAKSTSVHATPTIPFSAGGPLLAQAKISDSQLSFFKMLDEKIESGPDIDSDEEETCHERLRSSLELWAALLKDRNSQRSHKPQLRRVDAIEVESSFESSFDNNNTEISKHTEIVAEESLNDTDEIKEQYMIMGNLYTLTRMGGDGNEIPLVNVSPAPSPLASTKIPRRRYPKSNGTTQKPVQTRTKRLQRADTPAHRTTLPNQPSRPASLVLKTVFQNEAKDVT